MIPAVMLVGLLAPLAVRLRLKTLVVVGAIVSLAWGSAVASVGAFVGGTLLAVPNYIVGVLIGLGVRQSQHAR